MKIQEIKREDIQDWRSRLTIEIDGTSMFDVSDGELEDNNLSRNFQACYKIVDLLELAWLAGKAGQSFDVKKTEKIWMKE